MNAVLLSALLLSLGLRSAGATEIVAHRGASKDAPENTMAAFRLAWEQKADAIELDIYLTRDGRIAVLHDASTKRTAGLDKKVAEQTLAELQSLDAGAWKGAKWAGEKIPTLEEALGCVPAGKRVFIEIKCGPEVLPELVRVAKASPLKPEQMVIIGFGYETVKQSKALMPELETLWLASPKKDTDGKQPTVEELIEKASAAGLNGLDLNWHFPLDAAFVSRIRDAKMKLHVWTVDDPEEAKRLRGLGVDGIATNVPGLLRAAQ